MTEESNKPEEIKPPPAEGKKDESASSRPASRPSGRRPVAGAAHTGEPRLKAGASPQAGGLLRYLSRLFPVGKGKVVRPARQLAGGNDSKKEARSEPTGAAERDVSGKQTHSELPGVVPTLHPERPLWIVHLIYGTKWFRFVLAAFSGLLLVFSFQPINHGQLAWVALVPLLVAILSTPSIYQAGLLGLITGAILYSVSLSFFIETFGILGLFLANILSLYLILFAVSVWLIAYRWGLVFGVFLSPIVWTGIEYFRAECYFMKFSWLALGYSQHNALALIQVCDAIGAYGLSFIMACVNALITWFILERIRRLRNKWWSLIAAISLFVLVLLYGISKTRLTMVQAHHGAVHSFTAVVIQENIGYLDRYIEKTRQAVGEPKKTLVAWPEGCVKEILRSVPEISIPAQEKIINLVKEKQIYLMIGTIEPTKPQIGLYDNLVVLFSPEGEKLGEYAKRRPVQIVESIIRPGREIGVFETALGKIGVLICYEMSFSNMVRETVAAGANILVIPTLELNHWGKLEHLHHASIAPFRAIETRRYIIRPSAFGISMIVHPSGIIQGKLNFLASGTLSSLVATKKKLTFYVRAGYLLPPFLLILYLVIMGMTLGWIWLKRVRK